MEKWKYILNYEEIYQVSTLGRIRSLPRKTTKGGIIKQNKSRFYLSVCLCKTGYVKSYTVHRLVAQTFIPNPKDKPIVNHKDGNKFNNKAKNLEWTTASENKIHAVKNGYTHTPKGIKHWNAKLTEKQVIEIRLKRKDLTLDKLAKKYKVSIQTISDIINRKKWKHI